MQENRSAEIPRTTEASLDFYIFQLLAFATSVVPDQLGTPVPDFTASRFIPGLLGITLDNQDVFLVNINEQIKPENNVVLVSHDEVCSRCKICADGLGVVEQ